MKISQHIEDQEDYEKTLNELKSKDIMIHRKLIVEGCVLAATNIVNSALHKLNKVSESKDIKHNLLEGFVKREKCFGDKSEKIALNHRKLEELKYRVVHGKSKELSDVNDALTRYEKTKSLIEGVIKNVE
jgi:hypothetical protein